MKHGIWVISFKTFKDFGLNVVLNCRLRPEDSIINGHIYNLSCVNFSSPIPNFCPCANRSVVSCGVKSIATFTTQSINNCYNSWTPPANKIDFSVPFYLEDDNIIYPDDLPPAEEPGVIDTNRTWTWPTPSGITEAQANQYCRQPIESASTYSTCKDYSETDSIILECIQDIQVQY